MNPIIVAHDLSGINGAGRSACMTLIKDLGGYSEIMADNSALSTTGLCVVEMRFTLKRGAAAQVGATPWQAIGLAALDCLNSATQDRVLRDAVSAGSGFHPELKSRTEHAVQQWREALRIVNGTRPGNITGAITGQARFS